MEIIHSLKLMEYLHTGGQTTVQLFYTTVINVNVAWYETLLGIVLKLAFVGKSGTRTVSSTTEDCRLVSSEMR